MLFESPFDERAQFEANAKGYLSHVKVVQDDGKTYPVVFYDCARLSQDLQGELSAGKTCVADAGMIVLKEITLNNIEKAVRELTEEGYFNNQKSV